VLALLAEAQRRGLWCFATYDPIRQTGYAIVPFADLVHAERLQTLGHALASAAAATRTMATQITVTRNP
jgi:hypothetical protein